MCVCVCELIDSYTGKFKSSDSFKQLHIYIYIYIYIYIKSEIE